MSTVQLSTEEMKDITVFVQCTGLHRGFPQNEDLY